MSISHKKLGSILVEEGIISEDNLQKAIDVQKKEGGRLGEILVRLKFVTEEQMVVILGRQLSIPYVSLKEGKLTPSTDQNLEDLIPYDFAIRNVILPLSRTISSLTVAVFDPTDLILMDNLKKITGCDINPVIASRSDILKAIEKFYGKANILKDALEATYQASEPTEEDNILEIEKNKGEELSLDKLIARAEDAPIVKLVDLIISQAIQEGASDIHIEPQRDKCVLRYRIDGVLYEMPPPSASLHLAIVSRIKILSKMDIAEKRLPQDGGFGVRVDKRVIDLRVSIIPTIYGEKVVIRILDKGKIPLDLDKLGFSPGELELIRKGINYSYGLVFITGPTGSGKSTTLYAALNEIKSAAKNVMTAEDPVEYRLDGINQVQMHSDIGLNFAAALRSFLRQDPDIILVGEVRDMETAEICIRAALTGHLVLSTLHTNDAVSAISRLEDIGIPEFLVSSSLRLIVAQRLVRKLCQHCKEPVELPSSKVSGIDLGTNIVYRAKGCRECNYIGYKGRAVIAEVILVDEEIRELIYKKASLKDIAEVARKKGCHSLLESGLEKVKEGITSVEEVLSVAM